jgi:hypothetical protein
MSKGIVIHTQGKYVFRREGKTCEVTDDEVTELMRRGASFRDGDTREGKMFLDAALFQSEWIEREPGADDKHLRLQAHSLWRRWPDDLRRK